MQVFFSRPLSESTVLVHDFVRGTCRVEHLSASDLEVFVRAFTTPGYGKENGVADYERLEFLGDAFIHHRVSRRVFDLFPRWDEGRMTKICQYLWNNHVYPEKLWDSGIDLVSLLLIPSSEGAQNPGHVSRYVASATADCLESLVGALESTGNEPEAERLVDMVLLNRIDKVASIIGKRPVAEWDEVLNNRARMMDERFRNRVTEVLSETSGGSQ